MNERKRYTLASKTKSVLISYFEGECTLEEAARILSLHRNTLLNIIKAVVMNAHKKNIIKIQTLLAEYK